MNASFILRSCLGLLVIGNLVYANKTAEKDHEVQGSTKAITQVAAEVGNSHTPVLLPEAYMSVNEYLEFKKRYLPSSTPHRFERYSPEMKARIEKFGVVVL